MTKFKAKTIELGVAGCLLAIVLWLPFIDAIPQIIGIVLLAWVFLGVGRAVAMHLEDKYDG